MTASMTAFARKTDAEGSLFCEMRSVNHRYLEISVDMPHRLRPCEAIVAKLIRKRLKRGKIDCKIFGKTGSGSKESLVINEALLKQVLEALAAIEKAALPTGLTRPPSTAVEILRWPGMVTAPISLPENWEKSVCKLCEETLTELLVSRQTEGAKLQGFIQTRCEQISTLHSELLEMTKNTVEVVRKKLHQQVADLSSKVDEVRLEQEIVLLARKSDVNEELDRLQSHLHEIGETFKRDGAIGRTLDFIMQELNREANTVLSKAPGIEAVRKAVEIKALVEQIREQVQNLE